MKKALKITGIVLASLVGLILIVAGIAVAMVTSSGRLTKMVKKYAPEFITCEMELGKADLTLFKTFPNVGIDIENVALINPMAGSPSDTLANINNLIVVVDAKKFLKEKEIVVRRCILEDAFVNLYTDSIGNSNLDVFNAKKDNDTTSSSFDYLVDIEEVKLKNSTLFYTDDRNKMTAQAHGFNLDLEGSMMNDTIDAELGLEALSLSLRMNDIDLAINGLELKFDGTLEQKEILDCLFELHTPDVSFAFKENYLQHDTLNLDAYLNLDMVRKKAHFDDWDIGLNQYEITVRGSAEILENKDIELDVNLFTNTLDIENVMAYLPEKLQKRLNSIGYAGKMRVKDAVVVGTYNDSLMPLISAKILTDNAMVNVPSLPYPLTEINLDADLDLDLNSSANSVTVNAMNAKFNRSSFTADGLVDDLLGDIGLKLKVKGDVPMTDIKGFLPKKMKLNGRTNLDLATNFTVDQLMKSLDDYNLNRLKANGTLKIKDFAFDMDTINVTSPLLNVGLTLPAAAKGKGRKGAYVSLASQTLQAKAGKGIQADMKSPDIKLSADNFKGGFEKMLLDAALNFSKLDVVYDDVTAHLDAPALTFVTTPEKNAKRLNARITLDGKDIVAKKGKDFALNSNTLKVNASVDENKKKTDFLNRWNPSADFTLGNAVVQVDGIDEDIKISNIDFLFNSHELDFKKSTFRLGKSDFSLQGSVIGIKEWVEDHKNLMKGEMQLTSNFADINEILDLTSGLGHSDAEPSVPESIEGVEATVTENTTDDPFMVPEGIDFNFVLNTKKALYDNFDLNNLNGTMTVKDGTLILREIGFTNKAAEMQLTALYQSPRKNNLYLAMDFHLLRVQINDLLTMIPYIDTLVPMLKTFDGQAEFHIGAETRLTSNYQPKISTLRAAADIEGKNLTVKDKFTFTKITDMLDISTNGQYRVDSLDVQLTAFKDEIDLWPSQIAIGKYKVTVDGRMKLDKNGEYHLSVTQSPLPVRLGLMISGPLNNLEYKLEGCKYPNLYKPNKRNDTEQMYFELKKMIADRLKANVR
ncbi:MAG: hypothetical protein II829_03410 [Bacteroidales bacterium]|nr:hypothetical protein [Bacteroidales bacterium]